MPKKKQQPEPWKIRQSQSRKKNKISQRKKYLICTEGKTEAVYFSNYNSSTGPEIVSIDKSDQKISLIEKVIKERDAREQNGEFDSEIDEVWVVFDRDIAPSNKDDRHKFNKALDLAARDKIQVAYSNDAFEVWILLHYQEITTPLHRSTLNRKIKEHRGKKYSKGENLYEEIRANRPIAIKRANRLLSLSHDAQLPPEKANPSTTVHRLVEKLLKEPGFREK